MRQPGLNVLADYHCNETIDPRPDGEIPPRYYFHIRQELKVSHYVVRSEFLGPICVTVSSDAGNRFHYVYLRTKYGFREFSVDCTSPEYMAYQQDHLQRHFGRNLQIDTKKRVVGYALHEFVIKHYLPESLEGGMGLGEFREDEPIDHHTDVTVRVQAKAQESLHSAALHRKSLLTEHIPLVACSILKITASLDEFEQDLRILDERKQLGDHCVDVFTSTPVLGDTASHTEGIDHPVPALARMCPVPVSQFQRLIVEGCAVDQWCKQRFRQVSAPPQKRSFAYSMRELIDTEAAYFERIRSLQNHWHLSLKGSIIEIYRTSLPKEWANSPLMFVDQLFPSVAPLISVHEKFLWQLQNVGDDAASVARYLLDLLSDPAAAAVYMDLLVCGVTAALKYQREHLRSPESCLNGFYNGTLKTHANTTDPAVAYQMVQQRFTKYMILYREMAQLFPGEELFAKALKELDSFLKKAESKRLQYFASTSKALLISSFQGMPQTMLNDDSWVGRFDFIQQNHARPAKTTDLSLVLLNNCVMIGRPPPKITDPMRAQQYRRQIEAAAQAFVTVTPGYMPDIFENQELIRIAELRDYKFIGRIDLQDVDVIDISDKKILLVIKDPEDEFRFASQLEGDNASILSRSAPMTGMKASSIITSLGDRAGSSLEKYPSGPPGTAVLHLVAPSFAMKRKALRALRWALTLSKRTEPDTTFYANEFANQDFYFRLHGPKEPETRSKIALLVAEGDSQDVDESLVGMAMGYPSIGIVSQTCEETIKSANVDSSAQSETLAEGDLGQLAPSPVEENSALPRVLLALGRVTFGGGDHHSNRVSFQSCKSENDFFLRILGAEDWLQQCTQHYEFYEALSRDVLLHDIVQRYFDTRHSVVQDSLKRGVQQVVNLSNQLSDTLSIWSRADSHYTTSGPGPHRSRLATIGSAFSTRAKSLFNVAAPSTNNPLPPLPPLPPVPRLPLDERAATNSGDAPRHVAASTSSMATKSRLRGILSSRRRVGERNLSAEAALPPPSKNHSHSAPLPPPSRLDPGPALPPVQDYSLRLISTVSQHLESKAEHEEGLYRRSGSKSETDTIEKVMLNSPEAICNNPGIMEDWDPLAIANAFKRYMGTSGPLRLPDTARRALCEAYNACLRSAGALTLPVEIKRVWDHQIPNVLYKQAAYKFLSHLKRLCEIKGQNRMTAVAIATSINQSFLSFDDSFVDFGSVNAVFRSLIESFDFIFGKAEDAPRDASLSQQTLYMSELSLNAMKRSKNSSAELADKHAATPSFETRSNLRKDKRLVSVSSTTSLNDVESQAEAVCET